jgi:phosphomannomutase
MALTLDAMASTGKSLSELTDELPRYEIHKAKATVARDAVEAVFDKLEAKFSDAKPDRMDGLRLDWPDKWLLVRASNTEPIVRFIAEAKTLAAAKLVCDMAQTLV